MVMVIEAVGIGLSMEWEDKIMTLVFHRLPLVLKDTVLMDTTDLAGALALDLDLKDTTDQARIQDSVLMDSTGQIRIQDLVPKDSIDLIQFQDLVSATSIVLVLIKDLVRITDHNLVEDQGSPNLICRNQANVERLANLEIVSLVEK